MKKPRRRQKAVSEVISTVILAATVIMISLIVFYYAMLSFQTSSLATQFGYTKSVLLVLASNINYILAGNQYYANIPTKSVGVGYNHTSTYTLSIGIPAYNITIKIYNPLNRPLENYQVLVWLNSTNFHGWKYLNMTGNTTDFIFVDPNYHILSFYVQEFNPASEQAKIWVKIPYIPSNGSINITMFYGNPSIKGTSDFYAVFDKFYDDFTSNPYTDGKWVIFKNLGSNTSAEFVWDQKLGIVNLTTLDTDLGTIGFAAQNGKPIEGLPVRAVIRYLGGNPANQPADGFAFAFNKNITTYELYADKYNDSGQGGSLYLELFKEYSSSSIKLIKSDGYALVLDAYRNLNTRIPQYSDPPVPYVAIERTNVTFPYPKIDNKYNTTSIVTDLRWHVIELNIAPDYSYANVSIDGYLSSNLTNIRLPGIIPGCTGFGIAAATGGLYAYFCVDYVDVYYRKYYGVDPQVYVYPVNGTGYAPIYTMDYLGIYTAAYAAFTTTWQVVYGTSNYTVDDIRLLPRVVQFYKDGFTYAELDTFRFLVNRYEIRTATGTTTNTTYIISMLGVELSPQIMSSSPSQLVVSYAGIAYTRSFNTTGLAVIVSINGRHKITDLASLLPGYKPPTSSIEIFITIKKLNVVFI